MMMWATPTAEGDDCATSIARQFLDDPGRPPDTACVDRVTPPRFSGTPEQNLFLLGAVDAWDG